MAIPAQPDRRDTSARCGHWCGSHLELGLLAALVPAAARARGLSGAGPEKAGRRDVHAGPRRV